MKILNLEKGQLLIPIIIFSSISIIIMGGIMKWAQITMQANRQLVTRENAIELAESGIDYYRWHLAHNHTDYQDGTGVAGPYIHQVFDKDNNLVGQFSLSITPPIIGSTKVRIESTGTPVSSTISRAIRVEMAIPSLAKYSVVSNDVMRFGAGTEVFGPIHSNQGIRFDGLAHNIVTSALSSYNDPDFDDCNNNSSFAVHTCLNPDDPSPPTAVPSRTDVFEVGRQFPVPAVDFTSLTNNLANIKSDAQTSGKYFAASGAQGYQIILKTNDTFDVYKVNSQTNPPSNCTNVANQTNWNTWSVNGRTLVGNYAIPANGLIFVEDNTWVEGAIDSARVTIAVGRFPDNPSNRPQLTINNDLTYTNLDGTDVIALISQGNLNVGMVSDTNLTIDAALVSQNGRVGRYYYESDCSPYNVRSVLNLYGMIATSIRYGFAYTDNTGYLTRNINYDANLLYGPPPSFPLTSDQYSILSWEEI
ncbi:MAG: hypothetical protein A3E02_01575 [Candidatus Zambryskibacteria bacterium RIFCSPHIGHO2_12_FULL_38_34]|uniref:Uncharacterized protein n=1 Tax=Candidatus Zambryskibacteria bacterium RIFCSPLOWO2_12_FULL_39_16 TaxID=1802775 RepID=A0A1G2UTI6_9BACT|nr:MAG: hypothetical protein A3E02_01575 [Candidatus Zambryskibacteria bacterium RIFCSPHIGHO2_12_FULL_38_34]OHB08309.1 MAG: hypothetical protein A3I19_01670 [Candidatus Zambryskibacteria bacterium RIFCSPLOWO2_02_FULL_38_13]OHB12703.1 MAG: hypothetical protein A3G46_00725 [Candidatus Zambryskibacteria bacterium RIFCSPLOWO2_12_FULL_39_16]